MNHSIFYRLKLIFAGLVMLGYVAAPAITMAQEAASETSSTESSSPTQSVEAAPESTPTTVVSEPTGGTEPQPAVTSTVVEQPVTTELAQVSAPVADQQQTTASDPSKYVYNETTGKWENDKYIWDPITYQTKPKTTQPYSYNPETGMWDTTEWYYSPESGTYVPNTVSYPQNPLLAALSPESQYRATGSDSAAPVMPESGMTGNFDLYFDATISNKIGQMTRSGSALVQGNTYGGDATSGNAQSLVNLLNMIQSSWGGLGSQDIALFTANIDGTVVGDLYVDPDALAAKTSATKLDVTVANDAAIANDIDVDVATGNATVSHNTEGGNATTGNAQAVVNLMNLINSAIRAQKSFVGVLNINGSLNGDILLPPEMLQAIIAATGPQAQNNATAAGMTDINLTVTDTKTIDNNINTAVASGNAVVSGNTSAGSAQSGDATSNVVLLNLTGRQIVAKNAMLVFVNVMGSWVGLIFDAPAGTYAVAATGPGFTNTAMSTRNLAVDADITANSLIQNNVDVTARSGDALVSGNTKAGNATSGDAAVGVNVVNMIDSQFDVSDWFGVLFINVFGEWVGSFGVNTAAGSVAVNGGRGGGVTDAPTADVPGEVFAFIPKSSASTVHRLAPLAYSSYPEAGAQVIADQTDKQVPDDGTVAASSTTIPPTSSSRPTANLWLAGLTLVTGLVLLGGERLFTLIRSRQLA